jgi:hypothetical protein
MVTESRTGLQVRLTSSDITPVCTYITGQDEDWTGVGSGYVSSNITVR